MSERSEEQFEEKWYLPEPHRVDLDTPEALARLQQADADQRALRLELAIKENSLQHRTRNRALITRDHYEKAGDIHLLPDSHKTILAAAYAELGNYLNAAAIEPDIAMQIEYDQIALAVWRDEDDWCNHPAKHRFVERDVFSEKLMTDAHLLKCNVPECGFRNVAPLPDDIAYQRRNREASREKYSGLKPLEVLELVK